MLFAPPLIRGTLIQRYKRFFADVLLDDGRTVTAHCPNPGSMLSVNVPGAEVWLSPANRPGRTLAFTWELIRAGGVLVGINTGRTNGLVIEALNECRIPELAGYMSARREVRYGRNSRIDLLLESPGRPTCLVEVKNVTLCRSMQPEISAEFPDSVTTRGAKHLVELARAVASGSRCVMLYVAQRADVESLSFASDIDSEYARLVRMAADTGVECLCYRCEVDMAGVRLNQAIPIRMPAQGPAMS
ncbi:MAG: DNA/RNA nuclease SfsA [Rhodospirillales bacterium]|nr:DNA/RNA nuclease SfsA [Rhodospirillales bacterium]